MYGGLLTSLGKDLLTEVRQGVKALTEMEMHLRDHNSILVSGSAGPAGFAQHVYDFVRMRVDETISGSEQRHMFFVYHPDTNWWPQFWNLIRSGPLPEQYCAKSDDLDKLCQMMQHLRRALAGGRRRHVDETRISPPYTRLVLRQNPGTPPLPRSPAAAPCRRNKAQGQAPR